MDHKLTDGSQRYSYQAKKNVSSIIALVCVAAKRKGRRKAKEKTRKETGKEDHYTCVQLLSFKTDELSLLELVKGKKELLRFLGKGISHA